MGQNYVWIIMYDPEEDHPYTGSIHWTADGAMLAATQFLEDRGGLWPRAEWVETSNGWELVVEEEGYIRTQAAVDRRDILT